MKTRIVFTVCALLGLFVIVDTGCGSINPCGAGQQECPDGTCTDAGRVCCGGGTSCPSGYACGAGNTCVNPNAVSGCLASGEEDCYNTDGTVDCAPIGAACCGNHHWCPVGTVCINGGTSCGQ